MKNSLRKLTYLFALTTGFAFVGKEAAAQTPENRVITVISGEEVATQVLGTRDNYESFIHTAKAQTLLHTYAFTRPADANDGYFDSIEYELLPTEGLSKEEIAELMPYIRNPLQHIFNPTVEVDPEYYFFFGAKDPQDFSLSSGNEDIANIRKYRLNKNLESRKPEIVSDAY